MSNEMIQDTKTRSKDKLVQTHKVILELLEAGKVINYYSVAKEAGVSRQFLYSHTELRQLIDDCRISGMSKKELQQEVIRLRMRIRELESQLNNQ